MIITIDGPAGTGKSTVAKRLAQKLHFAYFDTGAMYRTLTCSLLNGKINLHDLPAIEKFLETFSFIIQEEGTEKKYFVGDKEVTEAIRSPEVTQAVSFVSALAPVRRALWRIQKEWAAKGSCVFEGRDLGTVVFPEADVKIFLTAQAAIRAQRRWNEMVSKEPSLVEHLKQETVLQAIEHRDLLDSTRDLAPLKCAEDAYVIDTSLLSIEEVMEKILEYISHKNPQQLSHV